MSEAVSPFGSTQQEARVPLLGASPASSDVSPSFTHTPNGAAPTQTGVCIPYTSAETAASEVFERTRAMMRKGYNRFRVVALIFSLIAGAMITVAVLLPDHDCHQGAYHYDTGQYDSICGANFGAFLALLIIGCMIGGCFVLVWPIVECVRCCQHSTMDKLNMDLNDPRTVVWKLEGEEWQRQADLAEGPQKAPCYCCRKTRHQELKAMTYGYNVLNTNAAVLQAQGLIEYRTNLRSFMGGQLRYDTLIPTLRILTIVYVVHGKHDTTIRRDVVVPSSYPQQDLVHFVEQLNGKIGGGELGAFLGAVSRLPIHAYS